MLTKNRGVAGWFTASAMLVALVATAPPAAADTVSTGVITCNGETVTVTADVGDTVRLQFGGACGSFWDTEFWNVTDAEADPIENGFLAEPASPPAGYSGGADWYISFADNSGLVVDAVLLGTNGTRALEEGNVIAQYNSMNSSGWKSIVWGGPRSGDGGGGDGASGDGSSDDDTITRNPSWHQAYGRGSATEQCRTGWAPSWSQWMNSNRGGWTCERSRPAYGPPPPGFSGDE